MMSHIGCPLAVPRLAWRCLLTGSWGWQRRPFPTQRPWLTTFASTLISLSIRIARQAVVVLARSPKPAERLWHSPHSARTLRPAGASAHREHIDEAAADKVYGKDRRVNVNPERPGLARIRG